MAPAENYKQFREMMILKKLSLKPGESVCAFAVYNGVVVDVTHTRNCYRITKYEPQFFCTSSNDTEVFAGELNELATLVDYFILSTSELHDHCTIYDKRSDFNDFLQEAYSWSNAIKVLNDE